MSKKRDWIDYIASIVCYIMSIMLIYQAMTDANGFNSDRFIAGFALGTLAHIYDVVVLEK